jgi:hypothetical protein
MANTLLIVDRARSARYDITNDVNYTIRPTAAYRVISGPNKARCAV